MGPTLYEIEEALDRIPDLIVALKPAEAEEQLKKVEKMIREITSEETKNLQRLIFKVRRINHVLKTLSEIFSDSLSQATKDVKAGSLLEGKA